MSSDLNPWDCFPFEEGPAFASFVRWLHKGSERPPPSVYAREEGNDQITAWAAQGLWVERAREWDLRQASKQVVMHVPLLSGVTKQLLPIVSHALETIRQKQTSGAYDALGTRDAIAMIRSLVQIQRALTAELNSQRENPPPDDGGGYDFSKLTLDEIRIWDKLAEKAKIQ